MGNAKLRWEVETTYGELKVRQRLEGGLRSRTAEGIDYEVAGQGMPAGVAGLPGRSLPAARLR